MLEALEMARVAIKARAKLLELYGDLEKVRGHSKYPLQHLSSRSFDRLVE